MVSSAVRLTLTTLPVGGALAFLVLVVLVVVVLVSAVALAAVVLDGTVGLSLSSLALAVSSASGAPDREIVMLITGATSYHGLQWSLRRGQETTHLILCSSTHHFQLVKREKDS